MHPLIEKVARAIALARDGDELFWENMVIEANAAIRAVLTFEPTPVMCHAAYKDRGDVEWGSDSQWRAMTAALLKEIENG